MTKTEKNLDKIYAEASQWVRMANTIVWSAGNFLIPASIAPFGALLTQASSSFNWKHYLILAIVSIGIAFVWLLITVVYYKTTKAARDTLKAIENKWLGQIEYNKDKNNGLFFNNRQSDALSSGFFRDFYIYVFTKSPLNKESYLRNPIIQLQLFFIFLLFLVWIGVWRISISPLNAEKSSALDASVIKRIEEKK